ncbi:hypothetical protein MT418_005718 [Batrachochytrium dendrobatidis]
MDQEAFRKLVQEHTDGGDAAKPSSTKPALARPTFFHRPGASRNLPQPKKEATKTEPSRRPLKDDDTPTYRDRAKERREGIEAEDFANPQSILNLLYAKKSDDVQMDEEVASHPDHSKNLAQTDPSGDLAPAKGLDIHQLRQTRLEMRLQNAAEKSAQEAVAYVESMHGATGPVTCSTPALQRIYDLGMRVGKLAPPPARNDLFSYGRMAFVWKLGFDGNMDGSAAGKYIGSDDMPSTLVRSKNDIQEDTRQATPESQMIVEKLIGLFEFLKGEDPSTESSGINTSSSKPAEASAATIPKKPRKDLDVGRMSDLDSDDDDSNDDHSIQKPVALAVKKSGVEKEDDSGSDIFSDAGSDYVPVIVPKQKRDALLVNAVPTPYFLSPDDPHPVVAQTKEADQPSTTLSTILKQSAGMLNALRGDGTAEQIMRQMVAASALPTIGQQQLKKSSGTDNMDTDKQAASLINPGRLAALAPLDSGMSGSNTYEDAFQSDGDSDIEGDDGRGDITQMDHGTQANKKRQLGRFDFDTLEEWTAYKEQQVHMPKAAFLFGVKAGDRRGKMAGMRNSTEDFDDDEDTEHRGGKLDREYKMLDKVYRQKFGSGLDQDEPSNTSSRNNSQADHGRNKRIKK